jgi:hypothetical protein
LCNTVEYGGDWVTAAPFQDVDGGALLDGGAVESPQGGTIRDGDYNLVGYLYVAGGYQTRRTIRVFGEGAYIEWRSESEAIGADAGIPDIRFDTSASPSAGKLTSLTVTCAVGLSLDDYAFTAAGDRLDIFAFRSGTSTLDDIYTYQRTCAR